MPIDLPIDEVKEYLVDALNELGVGCTIDGVRTMVMLSDLQSTKNIVQENTKVGVITKDVPVSKGSMVIFDDGRKGIVYNNPNDDIVSYSLKILICNATAELYKKETVYNEETGNIISEQTVLQFSMDGFIERIGAREKQLDVGILHESTLRFTTYEGFSLKLGQIIKFKDKDYSIVDIDDITEGLLVLQLASKLK